MHQNVDIDEDDMDEAFREFDLQKIADVKVIYTDYENRIFIRNSSENCIVEESYLESHIIGIDVAYMNVHYSGVIAIPDKETIINDFNDEYNKLCSFINKINEQFGFNKRPQFLSLCDLNG